MTDQAPITTDLLCPRCSTKLPVLEDKLPESCPGCSLLLRARKQKALNHNCKLAWKKALVWRGRAPRREFWGFAIITGGIGLALALLLDFIVGGHIISTIREHVYPIPQLPGMATAILGAMTGAAMLLWLVCVPLPLFSVTVRRLHDVGRSMLLPMLTLLLWLGALVGVGAMCLMTAFVLISGPGTDGVFTSNRAIAALAPGALAAVFSLIILMLCLMDSERGTNKYGPSVKYPLE